MTKKQKTVHYHGGDDKMMSLASPVQGGELSRVDESFEEFTAENNSLPSTDPLLENLDDIGQLTSMEATLGVNDNNNDDKHLAQWFDCYCCFHFLDGGEDLAIIFEETTTTKLMPTKTATMPILMKRVTMRTITAAVVTFEMPAMYFNGVVNQREPGFSFTHLAW